MLLRFFLLEAAVNHIKIFIAMIAYDNLTQQKCHQFYSILVFALWLST